MTSHPAEADRGGPAGATGCAEPRTETSYAPFARLTAPNAALYRQVMRVFLTAKERFAVHLRPEDVHAALPPEHGVDDDSRAKCLGLLHAFDLDVVMTSEREWVCYPQVPGIAIARLSRVDEIAAVLVTRWEWDGAARARGGEPARPTGGIPAQTGRPTAPDPAAAQDALWT
ncbi:DUF2397 family protein [Streptomyces eurythermus]|uniref:DUF2397 family protein n=1 Tax=Streptomyces eurythermus TaxID=42237 RepID=UPI003F4CEB9F